MPAKIISIEYPQDIDPSLLELLQGMLNIEFKERWKIDKIIRYKWVTNNNEINL